MTVTMRRNDYTFGVPTHIVPIEWGESALDTLRLDGGPCPLCRRKSEVHVFATDSPPDMDGEQRVIEQIVREMHE